MLVRLATLLEFVLLVLLASCLGSSPHRDREDWCKTVPTKELIEIIRKQGRSAQASEPEASDSSQSAEKTRFWWEEVIKNANIPLVD